jgi:CubicO group peptidase (beta-lactamase class C family)
MPGLDAKLGDLLPAYRPVMDQRTQRITLRQLCSQTAGYTMNQVDDLDLDRPLVPQLLDSGPANRPGAGFEYQDGGPHLLSAVIAHNTGRSTLDYARQVLFKPLDIETRPAYEGPLILVSEPDVENITTFGWLRDRDGTHGGSFGLKLTARDMVKLGELYRQYGVYNGHRILDESFVRAATQAQSGDLPDMDYGYLWWITPLASDYAYSALGLHGQLILVVPSRELVVAISSRPSDTPPASPEYHAQLLMVDNVILPQLPE